MSQSKNKDSEVYKCLERYVLSSRQQLIHGYPRPDPSGWDRAIINTDYYKKNAKMTNLSASQRSCDRCDTVYQVNWKGVAVNQLSLYLSQYFFHNNLADSLNSLYR